MPRWLKVLIALVVSVGVLAGLAEWGLRLMVPGIVETQVRSKLDLPRSHPVEVTLGGSALLHAVQGGVGDIEVEVPDAPVVDGVVATLAFRADRVPFAVTTSEMTGANASIFVPAERLGPAISLLTSGVADSGKTSGGELVVGRTIDVLGFKVPIEATLKLSIDDGQVFVEPTGLSAVGFDMSADQLLAATGGFLEPLLSSRSMCVSDRLPAGVVLQDVRVTAGGARIDVSLAPDFLTDAAQQELGTCG